MKRYWKVGIACLLVLAFIAVPFLGCGGHKEAGETTIVIGEITDFTGPAAAALRPLHEVLVAVAQYYNDEHLIPGVKFKLVSYDTGLNPARDIPGYEWVKGKGAKVIIPIMAWTAETVKPWLERDNVVAFCCSGSARLLEPPGWVFCITAKFDGQQKALLDWISKNDWDYSKGIPKLGFVGWNDSPSMDIDKATKEWCQAHPGKFDYVSGFMTPQGTMYFGPEAVRLKDCDYIRTYSSMTGYFISDYRAKGFQRARIFDDSSSSAFRGFFVDLNGYEGMDGFLSLNLAPWWNEPYQTVNLAKELLYRYQPGETDKLIYSGSSWVGGFHNFYPLFEIFRRAIEQVGAENFDGRAVYNVCQNFEIQYEGLPKWYFTPTKHWLFHDVAIYEWSAEARDLVRLSDWFPCD